MPKEWEITQANHTLSQPHSTSTFTIHILTPLTTFSLVLPTPLQKAVASIPTTFHTIPNALVLTFSEPIAVDVFFSVTIGYEGLEMDGVVEGRDVVPWGKDQRYPMEWDIIISPSRLLLASFELIGKYAHSDKTRWRYSTLIPIAPSSTLFYIVPIETWTCVSFDVGAKTIQVFHDTHISPAEVQSSCFFLPSALEFIEQYVGASYPFPSLKVVISTKEKTAAALILVSSTMIQPTEVVDQVFVTRFAIVVAMARQWFGHYIAVASANDSWLVTAFSRHIGFQYMRRMFGNNEVVFRLKKDMERLCLLDVRQPPLNSEILSKDLLSGLDFDEEEEGSSLRGELMRLKGGLVMYGKGLLSKVASKVLFSHMADELSSGLSTRLFLKIARKLSGALDLKDFADQWIYRSGSPIFTTTYNFNRKKMMIEVRVKQRSSNEGMKGANPKFTGPIVIRVQEPAGTFDTEVRLDEYMKQYDIIYHTKYKRIRRGGKKIKDGEEEEDSDNGEGENEFLAEPDRITFEWIRLDPDSVWACHKTFEQDDFMWNASLKQDKDIIGQYEAVIALGKIPSQSTCQTLLWVLKDPSFFYRIRMEAAISLSKFDTSELEFIGLVNLMKYIKDSYSLTVLNATDGDSKQQHVIPKRNTFNELQDYYLKAGLVIALSKFRDPRGWSPTVIRVTLIDLLLYNDNTITTPLQRTASQLAHPSDSNWIALLIDLIGDIFLPRPKNIDDLSLTLSDRVHYKEAREIRKEDVEEFDLLLNPSSFEGEESDKFSPSSSEIVKQYFDPDDLVLLEKATALIMLHLKRDRFARSHNNVVITKWQLAGLVPSDFAIFLSYSRPDNLALLRRHSIESLIILSGLREQAMTRYIAHLCIDDPDLDIRHQTAMALMNFFLLVVHNLETNVQTETRLEKLRTQMLTVMDVWGVVEWGDHETRTFRYMAKTIEGVRKVVEDRRFVFVGPRDSVVEVEQPTLKPLRLNYRGPVEEKVEKVEKREKEKKEKVDKAGDKRGRVLRKVMGLKNAFWFSKAVDPVAMGIPGYFDIVKEPMDLGTVKKRLDGGDYANDDEFVREVRLVFSNSILFNGMGSRVALDAGAISDVFEREFFGTKEDLRMKILKKLMMQKTSFWFLKPVDPVLMGLPTYPIIVKHPMDLTTIKGKLEKGMYPDDVAFVRDVRLVFSNSLLFNGVSSLVGIDAAGLLGMFEKEFGAKIGELEDIVMDEIVDVEMAGVETFDKATSLSTPTPLTPKTSLSLPTPSMAHLSLSTPTPSNAKMPPPTSKPMFKIKLTPRPSIKPVLETPKPLAVSKSMDEVKTPKFSMVGSGLREEIKTPKPLSLKLRLTPRPSVAASPSVTPGPSAIPASSVLSISLVPSIPDSVNATPVIAAPVMPSTPATPANSTIPANPATPLTPATPVVATPRSFKLFLKRPDPNLMTPQPKSKSKHEDK